MRTRVDPGESAIVRLEGRRVARARPSARDRRVAGISEVYAFVLKSFPTHGLAITSSTVDEIAMSP